MSSSDDLPECEVDFDVHKQLGSDAWFVRPCERYKQQYNDCKSIKARVHQYFIFGQSIDCKDWKQDFDNCLLFRRTQEVQHLQKVIESELNRRDVRLQSAKDNDIWKYRSEPPKDWIKPLPDWFSQKTKFSFLSRKQQEREN